MISFIVPAHDEEQFIGPTLAAIRESAIELGEPFEIIVANDDSHDATVSIAEAYGAKVVHVAFRQIAATRNAGAHASTGDILFFIDADTIANATAIRASVDALRNGAVAGGCVFTFDGVLPLWAKILYPLAVFLARRLKLLGGAFLFCRRSAFEQIGGFCERYYAAEEAAFAKEMKKIGPFAVPKPTVITSSRKFHLFSFWRIMQLVFRWSIGGPEAFLKRDGLDIWYGPEALRPIPQTEEIPKVP